MRKKRKVIWTRIAGIVAAFAVGVGGLVWFGHRLGKDEKGETEPSAQANETASFTFAGVGDNLLHDPIFVYYEEDNGNREYSSLYANTKERLSAADLTYINFETLCAGDDYGLSGYPTFNGPLEMIDALAANGFDWFSASSNHAWDRGLEGLVAQDTYIAENFPEISVTGSYATKEASTEPVVREVNGIKVGLATFTYGLNGFTVSDDESWAIDVFVKDDGSVDYDLMDEVLDRLNEASDVQIVSMHWGDEYSTTPNDMQKEVAQYLNSKGVEAVIGTHPHVIQPAEWIETEDQKTLVYYSLGNFISAQDDHDRMIGGLATFTLTYNFDTKEAEITDAAFEPTITWISQDIRRYSTNTLDTWTDEMAQSHWLASQDMSADYVRQYVREVMGNPEGIEINV
jgi:poly-gamma-glutamate synthesis protein (capsule biosynthesis protein)